MTPRCISASVPPRDKIPKAVLPMFSRVSFSTVPMDANLVRWFLYPEIQYGAQKPEVVLFWHVWLYLKVIWFDYCFPARQIECHYFCLDHNSSWCHISRWQRNSTTTILNLRSSTCKHSKRHVQNWKYFRFVVAIVKDWFAVDSNSICPASVSSASTKIYN